MEEIGMGGLSVAPLKARSWRCLQRLRARTEGGWAGRRGRASETADDAWERITHGADLVQGYSGSYTEGPFWMRKCTGVAAG
ncbi:hypothetical protein GCM10020229_27560 [Kitasatospora albolonga]